MLLRLKTVSGVRGIYGPGKDQLPARMCLLAPDAAESVARIVAEWGDRWAVSDMYRSAEASLAAVQAKTGVQPPGFSGHNFGVSFDLDVGHTTRALGLTYAALLDALAARGWFCHRRDGQLGPESWHFNFFGEDAVKFLAAIDPGRPATWSRGAEQCIQKRYPSAECFQLGPDDIQAALAKLGMYRGAVDGKLGPLSLAAVGAFCRAWRLPETTDDRFKRTLAFVAAGIEKAA